METNSCEAKSLPKIAVTGCLGYLGSALCKYLGQAGYQVLGYDNLHYDNSRLTLASLCLEDNFSFVNADVRQPKWLEALLENPPDVLVHLASLDGEDCFSSKPVAARDTDQGVLEKLSEALPKATKLIWSHVDTAYPASKVRKATEDDYFYSINKFVQMKIQAEYACLSKENSLVFRAACVYGLSPRMRLDTLFHELLFKAYSVTNKYKRDFSLPDPDKRSTFLGIKDFCRAVEWAIQEDKKGIYNLCESHQPTREELLKTFADFSPFKFSCVKLSEPTRTPYAEVSNEKILDEGFTFITKQDQEIQRLWQWMSCHHRPEFSKMSNS